VHQNALYASQFTGILAIGACHGAVSPSERVFADGSRRMMDMGRMGGDPESAGDFRKNPDKILKKFSGIFSLNFFLKNVPGFFRAGLSKKIFRSAGIF
jgi:hypothetical protein